MFRLGRESRANLVGVNADLVILTTTAIVDPALPVDFMVHDGLRTREQQRRLVDAGVSWTMDSDHLLGLAVDLVPYIGGRISWDSILAFQHIAAAMRRASKRHGIPIRWGANVQHGGDWRTRNDAAHFYLVRGNYAGV